MQAVYPHVSFCFPPFDLTRLMQTVFEPKPDEKIGILIDLKDPVEIVDCAFLRHPFYSVQKLAYEVFYQGLTHGEMRWKVCDLLAYQTTEGSNLELPRTAMAPNGRLRDFAQDIYSRYDIILCISTYSATAPLAAAAKKYGFRGAALHGLNQIVLNTGLSVDYMEVSRNVEKLREGLTGADNFEIDFKVENIQCRLFVELGGQEAQKSQGLCHAASETVDLPAGKVYFVPQDAFGSFPIRFEEGTLAILQVEEGRATKATFLRGDQSLVEAFQAKLDSDPATGILGEMGLGTQILPFAGTAVQDEKTLGSFHLAMGRNDHLGGAVTPDRFIHASNAAQENVLFSAIKTPEIQVLQVRMEREGKTQILIQHDQPAEYLWKLLEPESLVGMT